jgi:hypothetical protein
MWQLVSDRRLDSHGPFGKVRDGENQRLPIGLQDQRVNYDDLNDTVLEGKLDYEPDPQNYFNEELKAMIQICLEPDKAKRFDLHTIRKYINKELKDRPTPTPEIFKWNRDDKHKISRKFRIPEED